MRKSRFVAKQFELALAEERPREQVILPPRRSLLRIVSAQGNCNGVWQVQSALRVFGGGIFLGLEEPVLRRRALPRPQLEQAQLDYD